MMKIPLSALVLASAVLTAACSGPEENGKPSALENPSPEEIEPIPRWYTADQVERGYDLFQKNCAECHKPDASGDPNWKEVNAEGKLPPPPLNGTAHAWHHPLDLLRRIVRTGGVPMGGTMPPFRDKLKADEIDAILAWVQSHWSDEIYATWHQIDQRKKH